MFTMIIGGSASGKSEYAERHVLSLGGPRFYVATMEPFGQEAQARIRRHHAMRRDRGFETIECYLHPETISVPGEANILLEDLGNLVANILFTESTETAPARIAERVDQLLDRCAHLTVVTNEVFSGGDRYAGETSRYLSVLAGVNRILAERADLVAEVVCGIPDILKGPVAAKGPRRECASLQQKKEQQLYRARVSFQHAEKQEPRRECAHPQHTERQETGENGVRENQEGMIFVTGPLHAGKQEYIMEALGWDAAMFREKGIRDVQELAAETSSAEEVQALADRLARREVVIATEIGGGIVPLDPAERRTREAAGRLGCLLAARADTVIRICCGLPVLLKGKIPGNKPEGEKNTDKQEGENPRKQA